MSDVRTCGHEGDRNSVEVGARFDGVRWFLCGPCMAAMRGGDASVVGVPCMRCGEVGPVGQRFKQATLGGEEPRGYDGAFTLDPYLCVACVEREEARRAMDDDEPDPRTAHGPAWSAGTPRTAEEALLMLSQSDPRHALRDRLHHRMQRTLGNVVLEPSPRVTPGEPMPEATMPRAEWRATWRDAEVPVLCALRERCEASGARVVLPLDYYLDPPETVRDRYTSRDGMLGGVLWKVRPARSGSTIDDLCRVGEGGEGAEHVPPDAERWSGLQGPSYYVEVRGHPLSYVSRGWCPGLLSSDDADRAEAATPVDPATAAATWQAMRAACPERVYPEPTGESE